VNGKDEGSEDRPRLPVREAPLRESCSRVGRQSATAPWRNALQGHHAPKHFRRGSAGAAKAARSFAIVPAEQKRNVRFEQLQT